MAAVKYSLDDFIRDMTTPVESQPDQEKLLEQGSTRLQRLIRNPNAIPAAYKMPTGTAPGSYSLHQGHSGLFTTAVVWGPGDFAPPHDHAHGA